MSVIYGARTTDKPDICNSYQLICFYDEGQTGKRHIHMSVLRFQNWQKPPAYCLAYYLLTYHTIVFTRSKETKSGDDDDGACRRRRRRVVVHSLSVAITSEEYY